jgi:hypothetical protein
MCHRNHWRAAIAGPGADPTNPSFVIERVWKAMFGGNAFVPFRRMFELPLRNQRYRMWIDGLASESLEAFEYRAVIASPSGAGALGCLGKRGFHRIRFRPPAAAGDPSAASVVGLEQDGRHYNRQIIKDLDIFNSVLHLGQQLGCRFQRIHVPRERPLPHH